MKDADFFLTILFYSRFFMVSEIFSIGRISYIKKQEHHILNGIVEITIIVVICRIKLSVMMNLYRKNI